MDKIQEQEKKRKTERLNNELKRRVGNLFASRVLLSQACTNVAVLASVPQPAADLLREIDNLKEICNDWKYNMGMVMSCLKSIEEDKIVNDVSPDQVETELSTLMVKEPGEPVASGAYLCDV
mgnify:CR=1 FL=1